MEKLLTFILSKLIFFSPVFPANGNDKEVARAETFLPGEGSSINLSFEYYKMQDGWPPMVLSIGELNCLLWMDEIGRVS